MRAWGASAFVVLVALAACTTARAPAPIVDRTAPISLPTKAPALAAATLSNTPSGARAGTYLVRGGDTLSEIAQRHRVDMNQLARMNGIAAPYLIRPGQTLVLPGALSVTPMAATGQLPFAPTPLGAPMALGQVEVVSRSPNANSGLLAYAPASPPLTRVAAQANTGRLRAGAALPAPPRSSGSFTWPVRGEVVSTFGSKGGGVMNDGIDIRAPAGVPVVAVDHGVVAFAGDDLKALGNLVLIQHSGNWVSAYANAGTILVQRGDIVARGQPVATTGKTGNARGAGLHFELRRGTAAVDPLQHLDAFAVGDVAPGQRPLAAR